MRLLPKRARFLSAAACCVAAFAVTVSVERSDSPPNPLSNISLGNLSLNVGFIAEAQAGGEIRVGDQLMAIDDVSLDEARICKGSKVSVSGRVVRAGVVFLDVALADGHVVKSVPIVEIRKSFRIVNA